MAEITPPTTPKEADLQPLDTPPAVTSPPPGLAPAQVCVEHVSKSYRMWSSPAARIKEPLLKRLSTPAGVTPWNGWIQRRRQGLYQDHLVLNDVSFEVKRGQAFAIIGRNGSGKSTLLQIIAGTLTPTAGKVEYHGRLTALLELGSGFNPEFTGRENVFLNAAVLGVDPKHARERFDDIAGFADIGDYIEQPVKTYSSGMQMRLAFAVQIMLDPDVLIVDEALAVGDIFFQQKCYAHLRAMLDRGVTVIFVSHDLITVQEFCSQALVLNRGNPVFLGPATEAVMKFNQLVRQPGRASLSLSRPAGRAKTTERESFPLPEDGWSDTSDRTPTVTSGHVRVERVLICDESLQPRNIFEQGETAVIFIEYRTNETLENPSSGFTVRNGKNLAVHAKHACQTGATLPSTVPAGATVIFRHELVVGLACGQYTIDCGLISIPADCYSGDRIIADKFDQFHIREVQYEGLLELLIVPRHHYQGHPMTHFGYVDLPGSVKIMLRQENEP